MPKIRLGHKHIKLTANKFYLCTKITAKLQFHYELLASLYHCTSSCQISVYSFIILLARKTIIHKLIPLGIDCFHILLCHDSVSI